MKRDVLSVQQSARLKRILFESGIHHRQIADELGYTRGYVSGILNGLHPVNEKVIAKIEQLEGVCHVS